MIKSNIFLFPECIVYKQVIAKLSLFLNLILDKKKTLQLYNIVILSLSLFNHCHLLLLNINSIYSEAF